MILRDRNRTVDPCCDNVVGLVFGDLWPASFSSSVSFTDSENNKQGFALDVVFQNETVCKFCLKKNVLLFFP